MKVKILKILLLTILIIALYNVTSNAAISATSSTVNSGENVSISIQSNIPVISYTVTVDNYGGLTLVSSSGGTGEGTGTITNASANGMTNLAIFTFKTPSVSTDTTYYVTFNATIMEDVNWNPIEDSPATAVITVKAPSTPPSTDPEPPTSEPNFSSDNQTVYATTEVNVRSSYSTSSSSIGSLQEGQSVTRTGIGDNGWSRVSFNGQTGYIYSQYLTTTAPAVDNEDDEKEDDPVKSSNN